MQLLTHLRLYHQKNVPRGTFRKEDIFWQKTKNLELQKTNGNTLIF